MQSAAQSQLHTLTCGELLVHDIIPSVDGHPSSDLDDFTDLCLLPEL